MKKRLPKVLSILAWPIGCLLLAIVMWCLLLSRLNEREAEIGKNAIRDARAQSRSYAEQLSRSITQIDQITLHLKYYWTYTHGNLSVEDQQQQGLYPTSALLYVTVSDRNGDLKTSSLPLAKVASIAHRDYFLAHKNYAYKGLLISNPSVGLRSQKSLIRFSRRLDAADGSFDGVVTVSVEPGFLTPSHDETTIGKDDFISLFKKDGSPLLISRTTGAASTPQAMFKAVPSLIGGDGAMVVPGSSFNDGKERMVSWHGLRDYPLLAVVGMSTKDIYASFRERSADYIAIASIFSVFLALCAVGGMLFSMRLAIRQRETDKVREAYGIATEGGNDGFYMWRALRNKEGELIDFDVLDCNERGAALFGVNKIDFIGSSMSSYFSEEYFDKLMQTFRHAMQTGFYQDQYHVPADSPLLTGWLYRKMVRTRFGLAITVRDITETKAHELALLEQLNTDELTGLHNRRWILQHLHKVLHDAAGERRQFAVLFLDLDDFKNINDTLGHSSGDLLLQSATQRLRELVSSPAEVVRFSGDSFTVILDGGSDEAAQLAERILHAFSKPIMLTNQNILQVSLSIGISLFPRDGETVETLLKHADTAMHAAKSDGKKRYRFYQPQLSERLQIKIENETALRLAIERDEFVLHFQPRVNAMNGEFCSMEALARWQHPLRGMVSPLEFIPIAEETGLILKLGELIIRKACAQLAQWKSEGLPALPMSVNVSSRQLNQGNLNNIIAAALKEHDINPAQLEIELTESCMMADTLEIAEELSSFQQLGIKLLVDDFGTGYSSLSQLQRLDLDVLKVDKAFTAELGVRAEGEVFFNAIVSMAHALHMTVVAEGVETAEQLHLLQALHCDEVQGYYISHPVPAAKIPHLMRRRYLFPVSSLTHA